MWDGVGWSCSLQWYWCWYSGNGGNGTLLILQRHNGIVVAEGVMSLVSGAGGGSRVALVAVRP